MRFTPDGRFLMGASWKGWAQLWSTETYKPVGRRFTGHAGRVDWESISPDGRTLATGGPDGAFLFAIYGDGAGRAYRWDVRPSSWARHACTVAGRPLTRSQWREALPGRDYAPAC